MVDQGFISVKKYCHDKHNSDIFQTKCRDKDNQPTSLQSCRIHISFSDNITNSQHRPIC